MGGAVVDGSQARLVVPDEEQVPPTPGAHVYDAFGEPAGRVRAVRQRDFLLARPLGRDVYVPLTAIRSSSPSGLRLAEPNARLGRLGWERPKLLGLFGGARRSRAPNFH
jgi:hypothetical protein